MHLATPAAFALLALPFVVAAAPAQEAAARGPSLTKEGATLVARGSGHATAFAPDGVTFCTTPRDGVPASMHWQAVAVGRGEAAVALAPAAAGHDALQVRYERGACRERYDVHDGGLEQSFVFATLPPGAGDLVVRLAVATDLPLQGAGPDGLFFGPDKWHGIAWGGVTGIAADGQRARGTITSDGTSIELRLPAAFVDDAVLPLVLDPLIGSPSTTFFSGSGIFASYYGYERPDVATRSWTDATGFVAIGYWTTSLFGGAYAINAARVLETGGYGGSEISLMVDARYPAIATVTNRNHYVVVAETLTGNIQAVSFDIFGIGGSLVTVAGGADLQESPDIGGELTTADDEVLVVYRNATVDSIQIQQVTCSATGALTPIAPVTLATAGPTTNFGNPRISKTGGLVGRYLVTYESRNLLTSTTSIQAIALTRNLTVLGTVSLGTGRNQDVDGNGDEWVVAFERTGTSGDADVYAASVQWSQANATLTATTPVAVTSIANTDELNPSVGWLGNSALVGWARRAAPGSNDTDLFVKTIDAFSCAQCEPAQLLVNTTAPERNLAIAGAPDHGLGGHALLAYEVESSNANIAPYGDGRTTAFAAEDGRRASVPGGAACGAGGRTTFSCARVGNASFRVRLANSRASATSWLVLSPFATSLGCTPCQLVADPFAGFVSAAITTDASGGASVPIAIPNSGALSGMSLVAQWIVAAPAAAGACTLLNTDFSNGLQIRID